MHIQSFLIVLDSRRKPRQFDDTGYHAGARDFSTTRAEKFRSGVRQISPRRDSPETDDTGIIEPPRAAEGRREL
jgi:hypothetical protein